MEYKYTTAGKLRTMMLSIELGEERIDDDEEVRLISVATTQYGEILAQVDVKDSNGEWDAHCDFDITLGFKGKVFTDIDTGEPFEVYTGYGELFSKEEWESIDV